MDNQKALMVAGLGIAAYYFLKGSGSGPTYRNMSGQVITEIKCGNSVTFDVPGHESVWMDQLKNGNLQFSGIFALPMPAYVLNCSTDMGVYDVAVYALTEANLKGSLIGQTRFTVLPQA